MKYDQKIAILFTLTFILASCGSNKDSYSGPVTGSATVLPSLAINNETAEPVPKPDINQNPKIEINVTPTDEKNDLLKTYPRFFESAPDIKNDMKYSVSDATEFNFGNLVVNGKSDTRGIMPATNSEPSLLQIVQIKGVMRYAKVSRQILKKLPVIIFLHGQHTTEDPSYLGYDYLAKNLASSGYLVLSIDANEINARGDASSQSRAQLILGTLDKLQQLNEFGGPQLLEDLRGRIDFERIGLMGHSRGGHAVNLAAQYNNARIGNTLSLLKMAIKDRESSFSKYPDLVKGVKDNFSEVSLNEILNKYNINFSKINNAVKPYNIKGIFALAQTDFNHVKGLTSVAQATLLPTCDGDVADLQGAFTFDNNRFANSFDSAPRYQIVIKGANHNYFNTEWKDDDFGVSDTVSYCSSSRQNSVRLGPEDQQSLGMYTINSFMRYFVGDEEKFKSYWNATASLPKSVCKAGENTCDERVLLTVQKPKTKIIRTFDDFTPNAYTILSGDRYSGFEEFDGVVTCRSYTGRNDSILIERKCNSQTENPFFKAFGNDSYTGGLATFADQLHLKWNEPNPKYEINLDNLSSEGYDSLTFRVAVLRDVGQEINIELTDNMGKTAQISASDYTDALYTIPRKKSDGIPFNTLGIDQILAGKTLENLNMVSIPLKAFKNVNTTSLKSLVFKFPKEKGYISLNDIQLQKLRN